MSQFLAVILQFRRLRFAKTLLICLIFGAICSLFALDRLQPRRPPPHFKNIPSSGNHTQLIDFWVKLESYLRKARPNSTRIEADRSCSVDSQFRPQWFESLTFGACNLNDMTFRPGEHEKPRADHIRLKQDDFDYLKRSHDDMLAAVRYLAPYLPYTNSTSGIVMVGGPKYNFLVLLSLRMLRQSGSNLPVEVFLVSPDEYDETICQNYLPSLNARCRLLSDIFSATPQADKISQYQYKIFAILFSSFENVFFLDADAFVAFNPDKMLTSEPFISTGLVTWPDLWAESSSPIFFQIAGIPVPPIQRFSSDSGSILYSKAKHASSLLLATYYNYYGPSHYYSLLSQGAHGQGDKETYLHAAVALRLDFWDVKTPIWEIGQWIGHREFRRVGMGQHYPEDDFALSHADIYRNHSRIRPFILHINNPWKMLPPSIFKWRGPTWLHGKRIRLMGTKQDMMQSFGYDIEASVWEHVKLLACDLDLGCEEAKTYYSHVFDVR